jgi:hypothetical protein
MLREATKGVRFPLPDYAHEECADELSLLHREQGATFPEAVLNHGKNRILKMQSTPALKNILSPGHQLDADERKKLRAYLIEQKGFSPQEADRKCIEIEIRHDPTLCSLRDAKNWLRKTGFALNSGREFIEQIKTAKKKDAREFACTRAMEEFSRAISFAYYAGVDSGELKARAAHWQEFNTAEKRKGFQSMSPLCQLAFAAQYRLWKKTKRVPSSGEILAEIVRDNRNVRKKETEKDHFGKSHWVFEFCLGNDRWKPLPKYKTFCNRMGEWRKKYPGLG